MTLPAALCAAFFFNRSAWAVSRPQAKAAALAVLNWDPAGTRGGGHSKKPLLWPKPSRHAEPLSYKREEKSFCGRRARPPSPSCRLRDLRLPERQPAAERGRCRWQRRQEGGADRKAMAAAGSAAFARHGAAPGAASWEAFMSRPDPKQLTFQ